MENNRLFYTPKRKKPTERLTDRTYRAAGSFIYSGVFILLLCLDHVTAHLGWNDLRHSRGSFGICCLDFAFPSVCKAEKTTHRHSDTMDVQIPSVITGNGSYGTLLSPQRIREAKYEVLLFFVELLMEHKSRKLHDLSCLFGSPNFSPEMKQVVGGSQVGLKRFLLKHPSLFTIKGDTVTMTCYDLEDVFRNGLSGAPNGVAAKSQEDSPRTTTTPEDEAVEYFRSS